MDSDRPIPFALDERFAAAEDGLDRDKGGVVKVARGRAIKRTDAQIAALAQITKVDINKARVAWRKNTLPGYEGLIEAKLDKNGGSGDG